MKAHRRSLLWPFSKVERELKDKPNLQPNEAEAFHACHRVFGFATDLGQSIWNFDSPEDLGIAAGLTSDLVRHIIASDLSAPAASSSRSAPDPPPSSPVDDGEEFPSWTAPVVSEAIAVPSPSPVRSVDSSRDRSRSPVRIVADQAESLLIREPTARRASQALLEELRLLPLNGYNLVALFDFHGVLDLDFDASVQVVRQLDQRGIKVGCLSYCRAEETVQNSHQFVQRISAAASIPVPLVIAPRPLREKCRGTLDWSKAHFIEALPLGPQLGLLYSDDRWDIIQDIRRSTGARREVRLIHCSGSLRAVLDQWRQSAKGTHYLDPGDIRKIRFEP